MTAGSESVSTGRLVLAPARERDAADMVPQSSQLIYVCDMADVADGEGLRIESPDLPEAVAVFHVDGKYFATSDTCSHAEASLSEGFVENCQVECPLHFARFDLGTGKARSLPAMFPVKTYPLSITGGRIFLTLED